MSEQTEQPVVEPGESPVGPPPTPVEPEEPGSGKPDDERETGSKE